MTTDIQQQALSNAFNNLSERNYSAIYAGFMEKGIDSIDIVPRVNVFTFNAWKAKSRIVKKGEHGVKIVTFVTMLKKDKETDKKDTFRRPRTVTVFHITQTEKLDS